MPDDSDAAVEILSLAFKNVASTIQYIHVCRNQYSRWMEVQKEEGRKEQEHLEFSLWMTPSQS